MNDDHTSKLGADLRAELQQCFLLGFLESMAGRPLEDEDCIPSELAPPPPLVQMAEQCIDKAEAFIAEIFQENPQTVYQTVYATGFDICAAMNAAYGPPAVQP